MTADSNAGAGVGELFPSLARRLPVARLLAARSRATSPASTSSFLALPHGQSQSIAGALVDTVGHVVDLGADFRLPQPDYEQWYGEAHAAPELLDRFAFGLPELYRAEIGAARHVAVARLLPDDGVARARAAAARRAGRAVGHRRRRRVRCVGRGPRRRRSRACSPRSTRTSTAYGLLTHRHTVEMEIALEHVADQPVQLLFTPHLVPMTRGILATCYARPTVDRAQHRRAARPLPRLLRRRAVRGRHRRVAGDQGHARLEHRARDRALRRAHEHRARARRARQPREGRVGPGGPVRQPAARPPRDHRAPARPGSCRERDVPRSGFEAGGLASGIKPSGAPDLAIVATTDAAAGRRRPGVFTSNLVAAAPVQVSRTHLHDGRAGGGRPQLRQRQRRHRRGGAARRAAHGRAHRRGARLRAARRPRLLDGPHRHPDAHGAGRGRDPEARGRAHRRRCGRRCAPRRRSSPPTPCARRPSSRSSSRAA